MWKQRVILWYVRDAASFRRQARIFYDADRRLVCVIGGEGAVEIFLQRDSDHYESIGKTPTASGARTGFFASNSHHLYVAVPHRGPQEAKVLVYATDRN